MPDAPTVLFYVATSALIIVSALLGVLLYFLIRVARFALGFMAAFERGSRRVESIVRGWRRKAGVALALFR